MNTLIISNYQALLTKYGNEIAQVLSSVFDLISADRAKGIHTVLEYVDQPINRNIPPVTLTTDAAQNKATIDALYQQYEPDYMVLLGADDIIPFQLINDPVPHIAGADTLTNQE